jgi:HPt (histidine-containing phosphotransfer) domain-containing protein
MTAAWGGKQSVPPPSVPTLSQPRLDAIERDVSREFLIELVALFVSDVAGRLEKLSDAVKLRETAKAAAFAHALQGAAASLGVLRLRAVAQRLEQVVEEDDWGASERALARLMSEFAHVRSVLAGFGVTNPLGVRATEAGPMNATPGSADATLDTAALPHADGTPDAAASPQASATERSDS